MDIGTDEMFGVEYVVMRCGRRWRPSLSSLESDCRESLAVVSLEGRSEL